MVTMGGILPATPMNNGGAWDNAKKWLETGELGGKGSDPPKGAVVADSFEDTAVPRLRVLIKLLSTITSLPAALFI
jgi:K(+)-stimulated pyrophosphate-energized sodium pump